MHSRPSQKRKQAASCATLVYSCRRSRSLAASVVTADLPHGHLKQHSRSSPLAAAGDPCNILSIHRIRVPGQTPSLQPEQAHSYPSSGPLLPAAIRHPLACCLCLHSTLAPWAAHDIRPAQLHSARTARQRPMGTAPHRSMNSCRTPSGAG